VLGTDNETSGQLASVLGGVHNFAVERASTVAGVVGM
jgi:hypothetical protein